MSNIIFFDIETNGLIKKRGRGENHLDADYPNIVELSWAIYDERQNLDTKITFIVKPDGKFTIPKDAENVHGISTQQAESEGIEIKSALIAFITAADKCQILSAHNISFDLPIIKTECSRNGIDCTSLGAKKQICTMKSSISLCKIRGATGGYKFPKLEELYKYLFAKDVTQIHRAEDDVRILALCFFELLKRNIINTSINARLGVFQTNIVYNLPNMTEQQNEVFSALDKGMNVKYIASAGSGKTTLLYHMATHYARMGKKIAYVTYGKYQKIESILKIKSLHISVDVFSYQSLANKYFYTTHDTYGNIEKLVAKETPSYDLILFDEAQEISNIFKETIQALITENTNKALQLIFVGDPAQTIYHFIHADSDILKSCDSHFITTRKYQCAFESTSLRIPKATAELCNGMRPECKISPTSSDGIVEYIQCHLQTKDFIDDLNEILADCISKFDKNEICLLAPSVTSPSITEIVSGLNVEVMKFKEVTNAAEYKKIADNIMFGTFYDAKGTERKCVIVLYFDEMYFKYFEKTFKSDVCPNPVYVALTRATEKLILIKREGMKQFACLREDYPLIDMTKK